MVSAKRSKHPYEWYGLKIMDVLQRFGIHLLDEEIRHLPGLTKGQFALGVMWMEDHQLIIPKSPFDSPEIIPPFYLN